MDKIYTCFKFLTYPGAMTRGFFEQFVCKFLNIPVEDNRIAKADETMGHVEHELAPTARSSFAICFVPAFLNAILAMILLMASLLGLFYLQMSNPLMMFVNIVAYYFGVSLMCNSYPLVEDVLNMKEKIYGGKNVWLKIIYAPGFAILSLLAYAEKYCLTNIFWLGVTIAMIIKM